MVMRTKNTSHPLEAGLHRDVLLDCFGYDPALYGVLAKVHRNALRGVAAAWLLGCMLLGGAAAYAAWLVVPVLWSPVLGGLGVSLLAVNLLRVVTAGGGCGAGPSREDSEKRCRRYRPSLVPALVLGTLAALLSLPAQIPLWPELSRNVDKHRQALIVRHELVTVHAPAQADGYRRELENATFPVFRMQRMLLQPWRALRHSLLFCLFSLLPILWGRLFALSGIRAYEWQRCRRAHDHADDLAAQAHRQVAEALHAHPTYHPERIWRLSEQRLVSSKWLTRTWMSTGRKENPA